MSADAGTTSSSEVPGQRDNQPDFVVVLPPLFSANECDRVVGHIDALGQTPGSIGAKDGSGAVVDLDVRRVRQTRLRLKVQLPGNERGTTLLQLPALWPTMPTADESASLSGISPETAHRMLLAVREWLLPYTGPVAFVVANPALRPVIRRLIEYEFASVPVLSHDEVIGPDRVIPVPFTAAAGSQES